MDPQSRELLNELLQTPSPTGHEQAVQRLIRDRFKDLAQHVEPDVHGNLILGLNTRAKKKVMLAGHCDQIGFLVKHISPGGYLYVDKLGGADSGVVLGEHLVIHTKNGPVTAVVGRKPVHMQQGSEVQQIPIASKIWLDIGAKNEEEARKLVALGDYVTFRLQVTDLRDDLICAPGLDNKAGLFVCLEVFRQCARSGCPVALYVASTVQEEIGSRGASTVTSRLSPDVGIAVDVVPATDDPGNDGPPQANVPVKLRGGPTISTGPNTNPVVGSMLTAAATKLELAYQTDPSGSTAPNDARMIQTADSGVAAASVGIPQRNMHTQVEICSLSDLDGAIKLLVEFVQSVREDTDLRPINFGR
ncbi:MAG TPA: M20/M25/M40 family metallo-hydrolase [Tepidisphaeraceae bacterium]|nr:M20/M25/M40 family metallo-hydrolase [Tepidisphaeraceae bacterium]